RSWGMLPVTAHSGDEALTLARSAVADGQPFDVVVVDADMPGSDGPTLVATLGTDAGAPRPPVLMMTAARSSAVEGVAAQLPEPNGYEATLEIRRRQYPHRRTPVIAMTAGATQADRDRCFQADMDDYISKPVRPEQLSTVLARWAPADAGAKGGAP